MRTAGERSTSTQHSSATFFGRSGSGGFFGASADTDVSADASSADASISRVASPMVQRQLQPAASQSVAGMTLEEKWGIVYASALQGAGDGVVMALAIILGIMVLFALVAAIVAFLCPECIAAIAGFLSTVVWGAAVSTWLAAGLAALGISAALTVLIHEFRTVHRDVASAQTVADLQNAGRNWGYRSGMALVDLVTSIMGLIPGIRRQAARLARRLLPAGGGPSPGAAAPVGTPAPGRPAATPPPIPARPPAQAPVPTGPPPLPARPAPAPTGPPPVPARLPVRSPSIAQAAGHAFSLASRRILRYFGRDIVVVITARGPRAFYRRTGTGGGRPPGHAGAQAGNWAPFEYITPDGLKKNKYYQVPPDDPLYGYGNEDFLAAGQWLDRQALPSGEDVGTDPWPVNYFLRELGCPIE